MKALEASLADGLPQPSYFEADLVKVKKLLYDWSMLWGKATADERKENVAALFDEVRVRDKAIVSATLADPAYAPPIASSEARRLRLVTPEPQSSKTVGLAPPDGLKPPTARQTWTTTSRSDRCRVACQVDSPPDMSTLSTSTSVVQPTW